MEKEPGLYKEKLKRYYNNEDKHLQYPSKKPMRILALVKIISKFDSSRKYTEKEINKIIKDEIVFCDIELIRREMYQYQFIGRLRDGSEYWIEDKWKEKYKDYII